MPLYTHHGDEGETERIGGRRIPKDSPLITACGTVDELNAQVGLARALLSDIELDALLVGIQSELFTLGADLATPAEDAQETGTRITPAATDQLEAEIDRLEGELTPLHQFILPGGSPAAAALHVARCVCRRAERQVVTLGRMERINRETLRYLNRLSDLLFVLARVVNARGGTPEPVWKAREERG